MRTPNGQKLTVVSIKAPRAMIRAAKSRSKAGNISFSEYLRRLIQRDLALTKDAAA